MLVVVPLTALALVAFTWWSGRGGDPEPDARARAHAESACDLVSKAHEAAEVESDARYAATVLVLDRAIIESERAARADVVFGDLDRVVQGVHTAAHTGDPAKYTAAMDAAQDACRREVARVG